MPGRHDIAAIKGWETRRANERRAQLEWDDAVALAAREDERDRIRRELLAWYAEQEAWNDGERAEELFHEALDRICPEEP